MKKIFNILLLAVFTLSVFTACEKDDDSNPVLKEPTTFSLNLPPYAANNIYDLKNAKTVELTCSQPDYGFPAATTYSVQVALNSEFTEKTEESEANYTELTTTYSTAKMDVVYNPQIQISAESETKRSIFREKDKTKRSKKESAQHSKSRNKSFVMTSVSAL